MAPKTAEQIRADRDSDRALTIMAAIAGGLVAIVAAASFIKETLALGGPRRRQPWDV